MIRPQALDDTSSLQDLIAGELERIRVLKARPSIRLDPDLLRRAEMALENADCPSCGEAQADGIPCPSPASMCDACVRSLEHLQALRTEMEGACGDSSEI
jgi:hypothetical protein